jgi:hypothetical protein
MAAHIPCPRPVTERDVTITTQLDQPATHCPPTLVARVVGTSARGQDIEAMHELPAAPASISNVPARSRKNPSSFEDSAAPRFSTFLIDTAVCGRPTTVVYSRHDCRAAWGSLVLPRA